jgi:hypothetical protein
MAVEVLDCCRDGAHPCRKEPRERNEASRGRELGDQREKLLLTGLGKMTLLHGCRVPWLLEVEDNGENCSQGEAPAGKMEARASSAAAVRGRRIRGAAPWLAEGEELLRAGCCSRGAGRKKLLAAERKGGVGVQNCQVQGERAPIYRHMVGLGFFLVGLLG